VGLLDWLRTHLGGADHRLQQRTAETLERIVELANPRLRYARRYRSRLAPAVDIALEYARFLVEKTAPARDVGASAWQADGSLRAFFATANDVARIYSRSPELRAWFEAYPTAQEVFAVLSMALVERRVLGIAMVHGQLQREVPQTTVSFQDHRVRIFGRTEAELRAEIERRIVDQLALTAIAAAVEDESRRHTLAQENALLKARLRLLQGKGVGLTGLAGKPSSSPDKLAALQRDLAVNEGNLKSLAAGSEALDQQIERLRAVLSNPHEQFFLTPRRLRLDRMNILLDEDAREPFEPLELQIAHVPIPAEQPEFRTFALTRFPRSALLPMSLLLADAARMLH